MQVADGSLKDYKDKYIMKMKKYEVNAHIKTICEELRSQLVCMLEQGLVYTDMKLANCLYKMVDGKPVFLIGDLGGAYKDQDGDQVPTYPPSEYINNSPPGYFSIDPKSQSAVLSWNIGLMLYSLIPFVNDAHTCHKKSIQFLAYANPCEDAATAPTW